MLAASADNNRVPFSGNLFHDLRENVDVLIFFHVFFTGVEDCLHQASGYQSGDQIL